MGGCTIPKDKQFVIENELFTESCPNLKPPTISQFIHVIETLLGELFPGIKLNNDNYKEVITDMLKVLQFPGTIPISTLKTVNVMRTWPQIVALFAFLIDKVNLQRRDPFEDIPRSFTTQEEEINCKRFVYTEEHILREYRIFNSDCTEEDEMIVGGYTRNIADLMGVDTDRIEFLKKDIAERKKLLESQNEEIDKLNKEEKEILNAIKDIDSAAIAIEEFTELETAKTTKEFEEISKTVEKLPAIIEELKENVAKLESEIEKQPCTIQDMEMMLQQIDTLNSKIDVKIAKVKHARDIKEEYDAKLDEERTMLRDMVVKWNLSLMKIIVRMPHIKKLLLPESGFHSKSYLDHLDAMLQLKDTIERELVGDMSTTRAQLEEQHRMKRDLETDIECKKVELKKKQQDIDTVTKELKQLELNINLVKKQNSEAEDALQQKLGELSNSTIVKELVTKQETLTEKYSTLEKKRMKTMEKVLGTFVQVYNIMTKKIEMMMRVGNEVEDSVFAATEEALRREERKLQVCRQLKQIQEKLEQLHATRSDKDSKL
nr:unnamed protein product [Callosobruchus analis]